MRGKNDPYSKDFIYAIKCRDAVKIGMSCNVKRRYQNIQSCNQDKCEILGFTSATYEAEENIHEFLHEYRIRGEWFRYEGAAAQIVNWIIEDNQGVLMRFAPQELEAAIQSYEDRLKMISEG